MPSPDNHEEQKASHSPGSTSGNLVREPLLSFSYNASHEQSKISRFRDAKACIKKTLDAASQWRPFTGAELKAMNYHLTGAVPDAEYIVMGCIEGSPESWHLQFTHELICIASICNIKIDNRCNLANQYLQLIHGLEKTTNKIIENREVYLCLLYQNLETAFLFTHASQFVSYTQMRHLSQLTIPRHSSEIPYYFASLIPDEKSSFSETTMPSIELCYQRILDTDNALSNLNKTAFSEAIGGTYGGMYSMEEPQDSLTHVKLVGFTRAPTYSELGDKLYQQLSQENLTRTLLNYQAWYQLKPELNPSQHKLRPR